VTRQAKYIVTVNRDGIDHGDPKPILVEDPSGGKMRFSRVVFPAGAVMVYGEARRDGARVWIEADDVKGS
jgi:hypothetical protein